jgi:hypothetical protein
MTAAPKEIHRHTLMIINVECNVKMSEPHVIPAVPWDMKVTPSTINSG